MVNSNQILYNSKILKMENPTINVYPIFANPLAIMQSHQETKEWILCNFIQLCSNSDALNFYDFNYKFCPYLNIQRISKKYLKKMDVDIVKFIIDSIAAGYYIYLLVRAKEIRAYEYESEEIRAQDRFAHDLLIYGYDMEQQIFYIADNFIEGKYSFQKCTFQELECAINNIDPNYESRLGFKGNLELIEYYNEEPYFFNIQKVLDSFCDYVLSKPTTIWNVMEIRNTYGKRKWYFGLECYQYMIKRIYDMDTNNIYIQDFHLMWEHKKHLVKIITFLLENNYITDQTVILQMESIVKCALSARNLALKYSISGKESIKENIIKIYLQMAIDEKELLISLIRQIKLSMMLNT